MSSRFLAALFLTTLAGGCDDAKPAPADDAGNVADGSLTSGDSGPRRDSGGPGTVEPADSGSGDAGSGDAGSGDAGSGDAGSGDAGSGDAGNADGEVYPGPCTIEVDSNADGDVDSLTIFTYEDDGLRLAELPLGCYTVGVACLEKSPWLSHSLSVSHRVPTLWGSPLTQEKDSDADGTVDSRIHFTYDADGRVKTRERDDDADGTVDSRTSYAYDSAGHLLTSELDLAVDGTVDQRSSFSYDDNGNLLTQELDIDGDGDQVIFYRELFTHDSDGNLLTWETVHLGGFRGERQTFTYDSDGNLLTRETGNDGGDVTVRETFTYDGGVLQTSEWNKKAEVPGDPPVQTLRTYSYDANGYMAAVESSSEGMRGRIAYTSDSVGHLLIEFRDADTADAAVDQIITHTYDCWQ